MTCIRCGRPIPAGGRRGRLYCSRNCARRASEARRAAGVAPPRRRQHPALEADNPVVRAVATRAVQLGEAHGWTTATVRRVLDGLAVVLESHHDEEPIALSEVRGRTPAESSAVRVAEVLADLGWLRDDTSPPIRSWIERRSGELPAGFAGPVRAWLLTLLDGDTAPDPARPARSTSTSEPSGRWSRAGR